MRHTESYAELFNAEDEHILAARQRASELGCTSVSPGTGAALAFFAAAAPARSVVEIGTGAGVSGLHLFSGMAADGVLTSIDLEPEYQRAAKTAFQEAGIAPNRIRLINGQALDVLPRLTDHGYDLVVIDAEPTMYPQCVAQGLRLLRPAGMMILVGAMAGGKVSDPTQRDAETVAIRDATRLLRDDETVRTMLIPLGDGVLAAVRTLD